MHVDEATLCTILGIAALVWSGVFVALARFGPGIAGVRYWAAGCAAIGFAMVVDGPRLIADPKLASLAFNVPFSLGEPLILAGILQFCGRRRVRGILAALIAYAAMVILVFSILASSARLRIALLSAEDVVIGVWAAVALWRYRDPIARNAFRVAAAASLLQAAAAGAQSVLVLSSGGPLSYAAPELPVANLIAWGGFLLNTLVGNAMLFLLVALRLIGDLRLAAERDPLTGLLNRRGIRAVFDAMIEHQQHARSKVAILLFDIDHFKSVNDRHGHDVGDRVLECMGATLAHYASPTVVPCRWGGEEFCVAVGDAEEGDVLLLAENIRRRFRQASASIGVSGEEQTASAGVAIGTPSELAVLFDLITTADAAMYEAKRGGRDRVALRAG